MSEQIPPRQMTADDFRRHGHAVIDWLADYHSRIESFPVLSTVKPGEITAALPGRAPKEGESFSDVLADLNDVLMPGITHWQHPSFFAYFPANASFPSILGDLLSSGLAVQGMLWQTSPACTELETVVMDWLAKLLDLPERFLSSGTGGGSIQDSASSATFVSLLAALHRASNGDYNRTGVRRRYTVYGSTQAHSSLEKAVRMAGLGTENLRLVDVDCLTLAMRPDLLNEVIESDRATGCTPVMVMATLGTTSTCAFDPVDQIGEICHQQGIWLHVDAAYAGAAAVSPRFRSVNAGLDYADSYCTNPHKWLLTNFDCDAFWVADRSFLIGALSVLPEYLRNASSESGAVTDYRDWQVPLGRRFRSLKLWAVMRCYGAEGLRAHIENHVDLAILLANLIRSDDRFQFVRQSLGLVCFRFQDDAKTEQLILAANATGKMYLTHTRADGQLTIRMAIGGTTTQQRHVESAWRRISELADEIGHTQ